MLGLILFVILCVVYAGGAFFFRKKEKPSIWNSLIFGSIVFFLAIIFKPNYLLRLPNTDNTNSIMALIYSSILSLIVGYYGKYKRESRAYRLNVSFIRPVVLELGFTGLVLPYIHSISFLGKWMDVGLFPLTFGILIVTTAEVILNTIDREYRMKLWKQILYDMAAVILNALLIVMTDSVWLVLIPRGIYALSRWYGGYRLKNS